MHVSEVLLFASSMGSAYSLATSGLIQSGPKVGIQYIVHYFTHI